MHPSHLGDANLTEKYVCQPDVFSFCQADRLDKLHDFLKDTHDRKR